MQFIAKSMRGENVPIFQLKHIPNQSAQARHRVNYEEREPRSSNERKGGKGRSSSTAHTFGRLREKYTDPNRFDNDTICASDSYGFMDGQEEKTK
mmetsp:Transcript_20513/g.25922  ORF Transcript_20513/g.25922 Transcript_20513/m.25922 type:complete len:95 (-) Transcript_20513:432-716(-)